MKTSTTIHKCRFCRCTELEACVLDCGGVLQGCIWVNAERDVCSSPACLVKYRDELQDSLSDARTLQRDLQAKLDALPVPAFGIRRPA